jgi:hypothetical protein
MDLDSARSGSKGSRPGAFSRQANEQKELAWGFVGLMLWSGVVLVAVFGVGYMIGHTFLHWW